jgi:hypothetical protein
LGLVILLGLKDLHVHSKDSECPECTEVNPAHESECRYCQTPLAG